MKDRGFHKAINLFDVKGVFLSLDSVNIKSKIHSASKYSNISILVGYVKRLAYISQLITIYRV